MVDRRTDELLRSLRLTATEEMAVRVPAPAPAPASTSSSPPGSPPGSPPSPGGKKRENGSVPKQGQGGPGAQGTKPRRSASRAAKKVTDGGWGLVLSSMVLWISGSLFSGSLVLCYIVLIFAGSLLSGSLVPSYLVLWFSLLWFSVILFSFSPVLSSLKVKVKVCLLLHVPNCFSTAKFLRLGKHHSSTQ